MVAAPDVAVDLDSGHVCALCNEQIDMMDEVLCLEVVLPSSQNLVAQYFILENDQGEYAYEPYFFHAHCWKDDVEEQLNEAVDDQEPIMDPNGVVECDGCTSDILEWETCGILTPGDFRYLEQSQDDEYSPRFVPYPNTRSTALCISCLARINEEMLEMWENGITHAGACDEGVHLRCWRYQSCDSPGKYGCRLFDGLDT